MGRAWHYYPGQGKGQAYSRVPLPRDWQTVLVPTVLARDKRCMWPTDPHDACDGPLEVDHIGNPNVHTLDNLRALCEHHHLKRTRTQGLLTQGHTVRSLRGKGKHPGLT